MDRAALRARLRDILVEQGTEIYADSTGSPQLDTWLDIAYQYVCTLAAELDRSYFLVNTPGISYAASTNEISIAGLVGNETGAPTPAHPFRIVDVYDETNGTAPSDAVRIRAGTWEDWDNEDATDRVWLHTATTKLAIRPRPSAVRTLRIWWQDIPTGFSARPARSVITCVGADNIVTLETLVLRDAGGTDRTFTFTLNGTTSSTVIGYRADFTAADVAKAVASAADLHASFTAYAVGDVVIVEQATTGTAGNGANSETVANAGFVVTAFTGGQDAINSIFGIPEQFHILIAYTAAVMMLEHEETAYPGLHKRYEDYLHRFINFVEHRQKANPKVVTSRH